MASCQMQKPSEQICKQTTTHEKTFGQKLVDMAHNAFKQNENKQNKQNGHDGGTCQTLCQSQTTHVQHQGKPAEFLTHCGGKVQSHQCDNPTETHPHCGGKIQSHNQTHSISQAQGHMACNGKQDKSFKEKIVEQKHKVKKIFKRNEKGGESGGSSCSSSSSDSER